MVGVKEGLTPLFLKNRAGVREGFVLTRDILQGKSVKIIICEIP